MFFTEADMDELSRMSWSKAELKAVKDHADELYKNHRDEYRLVLNYRFAKMDNKDQMAAYDYAVNHKGKGFLSYDRTLIATDNNGKNSKVLYGFDYIQNPTSNKPQTVKHPYKD